MVPSLVIDMGLGAVMVVISLTARCRPRSLGFVEGRFMYVNGRVGLSPVLSPAVRDISLKELVGDCGCGTGG